jgi:hypothetical protein
MNAVVVLEWNFSPPDYFEAPIAISRDDYILTIAEGKAEARIDSAVYLANPSMRAALHDALDDRFLGVQLLTHKAYELSTATMTRVHPDGRRDVFLQMETARVVATAPPVDFQIHDNNGNIIADSKGDRIEKKKNLAELVSSYRAGDGVLASLLRSYDAAVRDPNNELVHLYEIRDALSVKFGDKKACQSALGISIPDWSRLGELCNTGPLRQGRHRGKSSEALRDATEAELSEARRIARTMIEAYLRHLDDPCRAGGSP